VEYRVISTDNHINEPPGTYVDRVPEHLKDKAPRMMQGADGGDGWSMDGNPPKSTFGLQAIGAMTRRDWTHYRLSGIRWEEIPPGSFDGDAHIAANEEDGVDAASIYPAQVMAAYMIKDREVALACVRAYNDWLIDDFCSADARKLLSLAYMPVDDGMDAAVAEAERVIAKGAAGLCLPALPAEVGYHDPMYDPLWKVASEARVPVTIHRPPGNGVSRKESPAPATSIFMGPGLNIAGVVQKYFGAINPISNVIFAGTFERFPQLVLIVAEVNCGWLPELVQMMDQEYERQKHWAHPPFDRLPSSYLGTNVFVTMLDDYVGCEFAKRDPITARTTMFSTDYPHSTTLWPNSREISEKMTQGMDDGTRHDILAGNAMRAYALA
jgi:predicted TIM-barrel fold metal-dependent hydrolase